MEEEQCNTALALGIGGGGARHSVAKHSGDGRKCPVQFHILFPPRVKEEEGEVMITTTTEEEGNIAASRSKLYDDKADDDAAEDASSGGGSNKGSARKKLRLSIEQSMLLEDSFRAHNNLTAAQKQELAERSNLRPRQVEVWFQNKRARTKLKQMEVDCDFLKKCCDSLSDENRMLKRELQELRAAKTVGSPLYIQLPKVAALSMCPSCERIGAPGGGKAGAVEGGVEKPNLLGIGGAKDEGMIGLC